jgi:hypothetical protein
VLVDVRARPDLDTPGTVCVQIERAMKCHARGGR